MTYTPTTSPTPTLGQSGDTVSALQTSLNAKYAGTPGYTPLKVDGKYGPLTQAATVFKPNNLVVTAGPATTEFNKNSGELTNMLTQLNQVQNPNVQMGNDITIDKVSDPYTQMLDRLGSTSDASTKALIGTIQAQRANKVNTLDAEYSNYKQGLQLLGIQHNEAQATPDLLMGHIKQAENEHQAKINALDLETNKALMEAENAKEEKNLSLLKEKMSYIKDLKKEKQDYLKNIADQLTAENKIADAEATQYYDKLEKMADADKETFLVALSKKYGISLGSLVKAMGAEKERREALALETEAKETSIANTKSIINERNKKTTNQGGGYTAQELRKLRAAGIDAKDIEAADQFLYGKQDKDSFYEIADQVLDDERSLEGKEGAHPGSVTADSFKDILAKAQEYKVPRTDIINRYKDKLYLKGSYKKTGKNYGLTKAEWDKIAE